jgi:HEAT repeat protein
LTTVVEKSMRPTLRCIPVSPALAQRVLVFFLAVGSLTPTARGQSDAERTFRTWADEHVEVLLNNRNPRDRAQAADYLGGFEYANVIAALGAALADPDAQVRAAAAGALWKSGQVSAPTRAQLTLALDDPAPAVAIRAAGALEMLGMPAAELVPVRQRVFAAAGMPGSDRYMAARGLVGFAPAPMLLAPVLEFLERAAVPRPSSAQSIAERESYEGAVRTLDRLVKTGDRALIFPLDSGLRVARYSQPAVLEAMAGFDPKPDGWTALLIGYLGSPNPRVRYASLALLGKETHEADVLMWSPRVAVLVRDPESSVRSEALWTLGRAGGLGAPQVDVVVAALGDPDPAMRRRAVATLGEMGDKTQAATMAAKARVADRSRIAVMSLATSDPDTDVRAEARATLARLADGAAAVATAPAVAAPASGSSASEASGIALLSERKITMEPGSWFQALAATEVAVVRAFLDAGMSASAPVADSGPPLVVALQAGDACARDVRPTKADTRALVALLLQRGADANRGDSKGFTPLMAAAMKGCDRAVMKLLIGAGAKVGSTNVMGLAAFDMGLFLGHDGLEELIAAGYRLPPDRAKAYAQAYADKPAVLALVKKATRN